MVVPAFILILMLQASAMQNNIIEHEESSEGDFTAPISDTEILNLLFQNNDSQGSSQEIRSNATEKERKLTASCTNNQANCQTCASATLCGTCTTSQYIPDTNGGCTNSFIKNCALVSAANVCKSCKADYYQRCESCTDLIANCLSCSDDGKCITCGSGYYVNADYGCSTCNAWYCDTCGIGGSPCTKCSTGYFSFNNICKNCPSFDVNCEECSDINQCTKCATGYLVNDLGKCIQSSVNNCKVIESSTGNCQTCVDGYYLMGANCDSAGCTDNEYWDSSNNQCKDCSTISAGCTACTIDKKCTSCSDGYIANDSDKCSFSSLSNCVIVKTADPTHCSKCSAGYLPNAAGVCIQSQLQYCSVASDAYTCTTCSSGAALGCGSCSATNTISNCACAAQGGSICAICNNGYMINAAGLCAKDCPSNCADCSSKDVCTQCNSGYFLYDDSATKTSCVSCTDSCNSCTTSPNCYKCADLVVQDGTSCRVDQVGYQLSFDSPDAVIDFAHSLSKTVAFNSFTAKKNQAVYPTATWSIKSSTVNQIKVATDLDESKLPIDIVFTFKENDS